MAKATSPYKFPEFFYGISEETGDVDGDGDPTRMLCTYDIKEDASDRALLNVDYEYVATYKFVGVEKVKAVPRSHKYTPVSNGR